MKHTPKTAKQIILTSADIIARRGLCYGQLFRGDCCCTLGGLLLAADSDDIPFAEETYYNSDGIVHAMKKLAGEAGIQALHIVAENVARNTDEGADVYFAISSWSDRRVQDAYGLETRLNTTETVVKRLRQIASGLPD